MLIPMFIIMAFVNHDGTLAHMADMRHYFTSNTYYFNVSFGYYELVRGSTVTWGKSKQLEEVKK
jgi:hypothetical protein